jgi:GST-like protein
MIDLYFWPTPNGYKISIMLEEIEMAYKVIPVNIGKGDQFAPEFLKLSPNHRMPAIVDHEGPDRKPLSIFESGAILLYLADKSGKLLPRDVRGRFNAIQWLMWQMGGLGPMLGQAHHFRRYAPEKLEYAINRYTSEAKRLYNVLDKAVSESPFLAGEYSIADIAAFPWIIAHEWQGQALEDFPHLKRWFETIRSRPAVERGLGVLKEELRAPGPPSQESWEILFGCKQYEKR